MAGRRATVAGCAAPGPSADEGEEQLLLNLTLDGVREGAYMLCKHADDLLGHHARQVFRDKAASMRAENGLYYFLKDLVRRFGAQRHASARGPDGDPPPLALEAHEFRKLLVSDPAFESAVPSEQADALFCRIADPDEPRRLLRLQDLLEFCLLDQDQLCVRPTAGASRRATLTPCVSVQAPAALQVQAAPPRAAADGQ